MNEELKNIQKLAKMLSGKQLLSHDDIAGIVTDIVNAFAQYRSATGEINKNTTETLNTALKNIQAEYDRILSEVDKRGDLTKSDITQEISKLKEEVKTAIAEMEATKPLDGISPDPQEIANNVLSMIKLPENKVFTPEEIRDNLETLEGDDRLDASAIKNLPDATKSIVQNLIPMGGGSQPYKAGSGINFTKDGNGATVINTTGGGGTGDVVGPASATDGVPALFDGTTGKLIKNSTPTGTGNPVMQTSPDLTTPDINTATADSLQAGTTSAGLLLKNNAGTTVASFGVGSASSTNISLAGSVALGTNNLTMTGSLGTTGVGKLTKVWTTDIETTNLPTVNGGTLASALNLSGTNTGDQTSIVGISGTMAQFDTAVSDGNIVYQSQALGTPSSGTLTNCTGLPVAGITASTSTALGVGSVELGHASDTTLSRASAGVLAVEGVNVLTVAGGTLTGSITLGENTGIALDPAGSADGKWSGITITGTSDYTQTFGDLVYLKASNSRWAAADADASATAGPVMLAMVVSAGTSGNTCTLLLQGQIRADAAFPTLTIGAPVYVGETAGAIQVAIPTGADNIIRVVGFALTADEIYFNPSQDHQVTVA